MHWFIVALLAGSVLVGEAGISGDAFACPPGYRNCGSACCPG
jgi:hypothetical protein